MMSVATIDKQQANFPWPQVSVVIPTYNDTTRLMQCLSALERQSYPRDKFEIVVIDNGSHIPLTDSLSPSKTLHLVHESKPGSYAARNAGLQIAQGEFIAFTDSDCLPDTDWLLHGVYDLMQSEDAGAVGGRVALFCENSFRPSASEWFDILFHGFDQRQTIEERGYAATANIITRRDVIEKVGGFDEDFQSGGDAEWSHRIQEFGYRLIYSDGALIRHPARKNVLQVISKVRRVTGGQFKLHEKDKLPRREKAKAIWNLVKFPLRLIYFLLRREPQLKGLEERLRVSVAVIFFRWVEALELLRLFLGGKPSRGASCSN